MYRKWLQQFIFFVILFLLGLELNYQYNKKSFIRHGLDHKISRVLPKVLNKNIKTIIFSTSVTYGAIRKYQISEDILDLSTVARVGILGQYFMLKRYLKLNKVDNIYMFVLPNTFDVSLEKVNYLYIESVFDRKDEKQYLNLLNIKGSNINYFYSRIEYLKFWKSTYIDFKRKILENSENKDRIFYDKKYVKENMGSIFKPMDSRINIILKDFVSLCNKNNIKLTIVMEPLNSKSYKKYKNSGLSEYITAHNINLIEYNNIYAFNDSDFFDKIHLNDIKQKEYLYDINKYVVNFLKNLQ